jgi:two-component system response regulator WspF
MRIAIANDAIMAAEALRRTIVQAGKHDVVWIAHTGADAVARCERDRPDLLLMDLFMPQLDGVEATRQIMARTPCAIVIATAKVEDHTGKVFEAMGAGAIDAVNIPSLGDTEKPDGTARPCSPKSKPSTNWSGPSKRAKRPPPPPPHPTTGP